jgi:aldehyde dehydrogenase (NAD+)
MAHELEFYIDGQWVKPSGSRTLGVVDPSNEEVFATIALGEQADVDKAVAAARAAFPAFAATSKAERLALMRRLAEAYKKRHDAIADILSREMGAPKELAHRAQAAMGTAHLAKMIETLENFEFEELRGTTLIAKEPIGVVGMITPWNWPLNQIMCKVAPALAAGCTVVLKPSEIAPFNAFLLADVVHEVGLPKGVFNLVTGFGPVVGEALVKHPEVDMISFTGSTRAGKRISELAAQMVKRVTLELGGKSASIILDDADLPAAVKGTVTNCYLNSGQTCTAFTRMLVPEARYAEAKAIAAESARAFVPGDPLSESSRLGPLSSQMQLDRVRGYIRKGLEEGAELVTGGAEPPEGVAPGGYFVRPTVFGKVDPKSTIAQEEIFGPVLSIITYKDEDEAVRIANDTIYGLNGAVYTNDNDAAYAVARRVRTGNFAQSGFKIDFTVAFGGFKQSGIGREGGTEGLLPYLETKTVFLNGEPTRKA